MTPLLLPLLAAAADPQTRGLETVGVVAEDTPQLYERQVALIIGIDDYQEPSLALDHAVRDAQGMAAVLSETYGFDEVTVLLDEQASREGILATLDGLTGLSEDDALLIFWAGHGISVPIDGGSEGYLLPWDGSRADPADPANLSMVELRQRIGEGIPARHKLLVVDACYSGLLALRDAPVLPPHDAAYLRAIAQQPVFQILTAGQADQAVLDEGPGGHSVFTGQLLAALDETEDFLTGSELALRVQREVRAEAYTRGHQQSPAFGRVDGQGDFILIPGGSSLVLPPPPTPLLGTRSRRLAASGGGAVLLGAASLATAALTHSRYQGAALGEGTAGLYRLNRTAYAGGWIFLGTGTALTGASLVVGEW